MPVVWPTSGSFPQKAHAASHVEYPEDILVESPMDTGEEKVRKRATAYPEEFDIEVRCSKSQVATFHTWFTSDANADYGAHGFDWEHPRTAVATTGEKCRIKKGTLRYVPISGDRLWKITFRLQIKP